MSDSTIQRPPEPTIVPPLRVPAVRAAVPITAEGNGVRLEISPQGQSLAAPGTHAPRSVPGPSLRPVGAAVTLQPTVYTPAATVLTTVLTAPAVVTPAAYLDYQEGLPQSPRPAGDNAKRAADAREVPHQNFWSSLTRAVGAFFRWVAGLTEADDGSGDSPNEGSPSPPAPGSRVDRFV